MPRRTSMTIQKAIFDWKETVSTYNDYIESGLCDLDCQTREEAGVLGRECWICGSIKWLARHHPAGEKHCYRTVTVCDDCHRILSAWQKCWDARWWKEGQPPSIRYAFYLMGLRDVLLLKAIKTLNMNYLLLANLLVEQIAKHLKGE
jgi:hypothetical protein